MNTRPRVSLETAPPSSGRPTQLSRCRREVPPAMPHLRRRRLPLGTIDEAAESSSTSTTKSSSESSSASSGNVDEANRMEEESDSSTKPGTEIRSVTRPPTDDACGGSGTWNLDETVRSDIITDVSVRQRCGGWRFSSSRPRLTVREFCRRRRDSTESKKRQRSASATADDTASVNDSIASFAPSTKRLRTSLKVTDVRVAEIRYQCWNCQGRGWGFNPPPSSSSLQTLIFERKSVLISIPVQNFKHFDILP